MTSLRTKAETIQDQLGTGYRSHNLRRPRRTAHDVARHAPAPVAGGSLQRHITTVQLRIKMLDTSLTRMDKIGREIKGSLDPNAFEPRSDGYTDIQRSALISLDETHPAAQQRHRRAPPVRRRHQDRRRSGRRHAGDARRAGLQAGLKQLIAERRAADLGLNDGWLGMSVAATTVSVGWNAEAGDDLGYRVLEVTGSASTTVVTSDDGLPTESAAITFDAVPAAGETVTVALMDENGQPTTITLTAGAPPLAADSFAIGADEAETADNFLQALRLSVSARAFADTSGRVGGQVLGRLETTVAASAVTVGKADPANDVFGFTVGGATASRASP